ncbi:hypothetical protein ES703_53128 [subsurface metagenome]
MGELFGNLGKKKRKRVVECLEKIREIILKKEKRFLSIYKELKKIDHISEEDMWCKVYNAFLERFGKNLKRGEKLTRGIRELLEELVQKGALKTEIKNRKIHYFVNDLKVLDKYFRGKKTDFEVFNEEKEHWILAVNEKIKKLKDFIEDEEIYQKFKGTDVWTEGLTEDEKKEYLEEYSEEYKRWINKDLEKIITREDLYYTLKDGAKKELEYYEKMLKELKLAKSGGDLTIIYLKEVLYTKGYDSKKSKEVIKKIYAGHYIECPFCKKKTPISEKRCIYCGTDFKEAQTEDIKK